ncbi:carboxypeptidase-like regulatory domain-containing protein [Algibacter sp. TI.3.09]|uniref:carboxypeptidase-like regulatory domain-containing protein n=1 Tax=Algibacter sp. TI.3.09 TaxID=3121298 RepID=UPI0031201CFE
MKKLLVLTVLLISNFCFSQLKAVVINSETKEKIQYVNIWVENENIGTSSNENGEFELNFEGRKTIVFSAIGFETKRISSNAIKNSLELKPLVTELDEVVINLKKKSKKLIIGKYKPSKIPIYSVCYANPRIVARFFEYKASYNKTPFLKKIKVYTDSKVKNSKFNIILYDINDRGEPYAYIYNKNIIGVAKYGKRTTEIDISDLNIKFPKKGFFIAIEWLIIESNKYIFRYRERDSNIWIERIQYAPMFEAVQDASDMSSWFFSQGTWKYLLNLEDDLFSNNNKTPPGLAIKLTLSN